MRVAPVNVRAAVPSDAEMIASVHVASIRGLGTGHYTPAQVEAWSSGKDPERYRRALAGGETMFVAQNAAGAIVGFAGYQDHELRAVYVHPDYARQGIASLLLTAIEEDATARGQALLQLEASLNAVAFYSARGYVEQRRTNRHLRAGCELDCVLMTKCLAPA